MRPKWKQFTRGMGLPNTLLKTLRNRLLSSDPIFDIRAPKKSQIHEISPKLAKCPQNQWFWSKMPGEMRGEIEKLWFLKTFAKNMRLNWKQLTRGMGLPNTLLKTLRNIFLSSDLIFDARAPKNLEICEILQNRRNAPPNQWFLSKMSGKYWKIREKRDF